MKMKNTRVIYAFTFVEIIVVITIISILGTIGFYNYSKSIDTARDTLRETDISSLRSELSLYKRQRGAYPFPWNHISLLNRGVEVAYQGYMNKNVALSTAEHLPYDPELNTPYLYSTTRNRQEYEIAATLENSGSPKALLWWDYKTVTVNILPHIILAYNGTNNIEINSSDTQGAINRDLFIFNQGIHTLPYDIDSWDPYHDGATFDTNMSDAIEDFWQNTDYRSCIEIEQANKNITPTGSNDEYQILDNTGTLVNISCAGVN